MVRCHLDGADQDPARLLRYVPLAEFELWRHLMESRHRRSVSVEAVSFWVAEDPSTWSSLGNIDELEAVLRVRFERAGPLGARVPVERYLPAETYPEAQEALLSHFEARPRREVDATPGYFLPVAPGRRVEETLALPS